MDHVLPFRIDSFPAHGRVVRLSETATTILTQRDYPLPVAKLLAEALALVSLLGSTLKFEGKLILQIKGSAALSMLVVDYDHHGHLRGLAQYDEAYDYTDNMSAADLWGDGHMALTIDQGADMERYQGIVGLEGADLSAVAMNYFERSEQLETCLQLAAAPCFVKNKINEWVCAGIILQKTAQEEEQAAISDTPLSENWRRLSLLFETIESAELLDKDLPQEQIAHRLFHDEGVRAFPVRALKFHCPCDEERVVNMLKMLPPEEQDDMRMQAAINVSCEFCNYQYQFSPDILN